MIAHPRLIDRITRLRGLDLCGSEIDAVHAAERAYWAAQDLGCHEHANELAKRMVRVREIERNHGMEGGE